MQEQHITSAFTLKNMMSLFFTPSLKRKYWKQNRQIKTTSLYTCLPIASHSWNKSFIRLENSGFTYSPKKLPKLNQAEIFNFFPSTGPYSIKASFIVQGLSQVVVLKHLLKQFTLVRK